MPVDDLEEFDLVVLGEFFTGNWNSFVAFCKERGIFTWDIKGSRNSDYVNLRGYFHIGA